MAVDEPNHHCFVSKQPSNQNELYQAVKVIWGAELRCIRYGGTNPQILKRLAEAGVSDTCDNKQLVQKIEPLLRNHVTFECPRFESALEIADQFKEHILLKENNEYIRHKFKNTTEDNLGISFAYSWYEETYYRIWFNKIEATDAWHVFHSIDYEKLGSRSVSLQIDE